MAWLIPVALTLMVVSSICDLLLIYSFIKLKELRKHPGIYIIIQCLCQLFIDLHWITMLNSVQTNLSSTSCRIIGALVYYAYSIAWWYISFLSIEVYLKVVAHNTSYSSRDKWYHAISHLSSVFISIYICFTPQNGQSRLGTCAIEKSSVYQMLWGVHIALHMPISLIFAILSIFYSRKSDKTLIHGLKYHIFVVLGFCLTLAPAEVLDVFDWGSTKNEESAENNVAVCISVILGSLSGFVVFIARFCQKDLLTALYFSIFPLKNRVQTAIDLGTKLIPYHFLFKHLDHQTLISNVLSSLCHAFKNSRDIKEIGENNKIWRFKLNEEDAELVQYQFNSFMKVFKSSRLTTTTFLQSFSLERNLEDTNTRLKINEPEIFAYLTADNQYYINGITKERLDLFLKIIKDYNERQIKGNSYLLSVFGLFSLEIQGNLLHFCVFENLKHNFKNPNEMRMGSAKAGCEMFSEFSQAEETVESLVTSCLQLRKLVVGVQEDTLMLERYETVHYYLRIVYEEQQGTYFKNNKKIIMFNNQVGSICVCFFLVDSEAVEPIDFRKQFLKDLRMLFI